MLLPVGWPVLHHQYFKVTLPQAKVKATEVIGLYPGEAQGCGATNLSSIAPSCY